MVFTTLLIKSGLKFEQSFPRLSSIYLAYTLAIFIFILIPLLILAILIPPNNWDSMSYHMTRVEEWRQNLNVYPFPTSNIRQVNYPPLAEYIILNLQVLSQSDYFANLVQYFSLLGSLSLISLSVKLFGLDIKGQFLSVLLLLSIPMVIFQSTSTQTDLTASFFLLGVIYSVLKILKSHLIFFEDIIVLGAIDIGAQSFKNPFNTLTPEALAAANPDVILVMSKGLESVGGIEGLLKLPGVAQTNAGKNVRVIDVDDSLLLSFGPRTPSLVNALSVALTKVMK